MEKNVPLLPRRSLRGSCEAPHFSFKKQKPILGRRLDGFAAPCKLFQASLSAPA